MLELPHDVCSAFDIKYKPPGYVSAGLKCEMEIVFRPKVGLQGRALFLLVAASMYVWKTSRAFAQMSTPFMLAGKNSCSAPKWSSMYHCVAGGGRH